MKNTLLPQRLASCREYQGLSKRALARASGLSIVTIKQIEDGDVSPRIDTLQTLARTLGVRTAYLIGEEDDLAVPYASQR